MQTERELMEEFNYLVQLVLNGHDANVSRANIPGYFDVQEVVFKRAYAAKVPGSFYMLDALRGLKLIAEKLYGNRAYEPTCATCYADLRGEHPCGEEH